MGTFCRGLIQKAGKCLERLFFHLTQDPNPKGDLITELISLKNKFHPLNLSYWNLPDEFVKDYYQSNPGIFCREEGPESCNCSCTYRVPRKVSALDKNREKSDYETKNTTGTLTDDSYKVITEYTDFKGVHNTIRMSLKRDDL